MAGPYPGWEDMIMIESPTPLQYLTSVPRQSCNHEVAPARCFFDTIAMASVRTNSLTPQIANDGANLEVSSFPEKRE